MSLSPLAAQTDVESQLGRTLTPDETARVNGLLTVASSLIRGWTRQDFTQQQTVTKLRSINAKVKLPQRPVISVDDLKAILRDGQLVGLPLWYFDGIDTIGGVAIADDVVINLPAWYTTWWTGSVQVTYTHGYATIPVDVAQTCAGMVYRLFNSPGSGQVGIHSERVYRYYEYQIQPDVPSGQIALTANDKIVLKRYKVNARTLELR